MTRRVYLVGAGPGDPGLITRRGLDLIRRCDVLLYDRLVSPELIEEAPETAELVYVGKTGGGRATPQAEIDKLMVEHARAGRMVVRLKGGDPFVFGRGADEAQALVAAGVSFEVVPGITSAIAVPAYAGIPVTHSGMASSFAVVSGHPAGTQDEDKWLSVAGSADTLVVLMGASHLDEVARRLSDVREPAEPSALIGSGTTPDQRVVVARLDEIARVGREAGIASPAILVSGPVVGLRDALDWASNRPLQGKRIVVTRARPAASELGAMLTELGAAVVYMPTIRTEDPPSWDELDAALGRLGDFRWIVFLSAKAVGSFMFRLIASGRDLRALGGTKIAAVGRKTADALLERSVRADLVGTSTGAGLAGEIGPGEGRVLIPRTVDAPQDVVDVLRANGWDPEEATAYVTTPLDVADDEKQILLEGEFDALVLTSPSSVRSLVASCGHPVDLHLAPGDRRVVVCIGPTTEKATLDAGVKVDAVASAPSEHAIVTALVEHLGRLDP